MEEAKLWFPVKVLSVKREPFTPVPVIYKPRKSSNQTGHSNVVYKLPGKVGECYEFAFVRSFSEIEAKKYVCCGCRLLKIRGDPSSEGRRVPYVMVSKGMFHANPAKPSNANHFCKPKLTLDVLHSRLMKSKLEWKSCEFPSSNEDLEELNPESPPPPLLTKSLVEEEHCYTGTPKKNRERYVQPSEPIPVERIPSIGPKKIIYRLSEEEKLCYEFIEKKTRSVYFEIYHCSACQKIKEIHGIQVGRIPVFHVRGEFFMIDPSQSKNVHFCQPKEVAEVIVGAEISMILYEDQSKIITMKELVEHAKEKCQEYSTYFETLISDSNKIQALERKLLNRNLAIQMSHKRQERVEKELAALQAREKAKIEAKERLVKEKEQRIATIKEVALAAYRKKVDDEAAKNKVLMEKELEEERAVKVAARAREFKEMRKKWEESHPEDAERIKEKAIKRETHYRHKQLLAETWADEDNEEEIDVVGIEVKEEDPDEASEESAPPTPPPQLTPAILTRFPIPLSMEKPTPKLLFPVKIVKELGRKGMEGPSTIKKQIPKKRVI